MEKFMMSTIDENETINAVVKNNRLFVVAGDGDLLIRVPQEEATVNSLKSAISKESTQKHNVSEAILNENISEFEKGVSYLMDIDPKNFMKLVIESRFNHNRFHVIEENKLAHCVNADDMYCSALINLSRPISRKVENAAFTLILNLDSKLINSLNDIETLTFTQKVDAYYAAHLKDIDASVAYMRHLKDLFFEFGFLINANATRTINNKNVKED